jgi:CspA family cold shock protein
MGMIDSSYCVNRLDAQNGLVVRSKGSKGFMEERETGTVKWFNDSKGYGFIQRDNGSDVFIHYSEIKGEGYRSLEKGQRVEFSIIQSDKGLQAHSVILV